MCLPQNYVLESTLWKLFNNRLLEINLLDGVKFVGFANYIYCYSCCYKEISYFWLRRRLNIFIGFKIQSYKICSVDRSRTKLLASERVSKYDGMPWCESRKSLYQNWQRNGRMATETWSAAMMVSKKQQTTFNYQCQQHNGNLAVL